jgi:hypothetical protein
MGTPHGSSCEAVNNCSTPIAFAWNTGSTPGASKGVVANTLDLSPNGVVRLIVTSGSLISAAVVAETVRFQFSSNLG